jgi:hypothetical protein
MACVLQAARQKYVSVVGDVHIAYGGYSNEICSHENVKFAVVQWLHHQTRELLAEGIHRLVREWHVCLKIHGIILSGLYFI